MKPKKIIIALIVILLILLFVWRLSGNRSTSIPAPVPSPTAEVSKEIDIFATPEHLQHPENHALSLEIIGPEGDKIYPAQARMYDAHIKGNAKYASAMVNCRWEFFLNQYNEEKLFQQMENTSVLGEAEKDVCGFTSTFINQPGQLRIVLTTELTTVGGDPLETVTAERSYLVAK